MGGRKRDDSLDVERLERHLDEATRQINAASEFIVGELEHHVPKPIHGPSSWQDGAWVPSARGGMSVAEFPTSWVIEVCRTCGRVAQWPFCEHRNQPRGEDVPWCLPVVVKGNLPMKSRLTDKRNDEEPA